jgi:hypothetical protein
VDKRNSTIGAELVALLIDRTEGRLDEGPKLRTVAPRLITDAGAEHIWSDGGGTARVERVRAHQEAGYEGEQR